MAKCHYAGALLATIQKFPVTFQPLLQLNNMRLTTQEVYDHSYDNSI